MTRIVSLRPLLRRACAAAVLAAAIALGGCGGPHKEWIAGWQNGNTMTTPRAGAAFLEVNGTFYALGGIDGKAFLHSTEFSQIGSDGMPGSWQLASPLREERGFFGAIYINGYIYVAGGGNGPSGHHLLRTVERAAVLPSGDLGPWQTEKNQLVLPTRCAKLVAVGNDIYAIGGFSGVLMDTVQRASVQADGHLGPWEMSSEKLTVPRYIDAVARNRKGIYVMGGHAESGGTGIKAVEWRPISPAQKNHTQWRAAAPLNTGRYALEAATHGGYVYAMGGLTGASYLDTIEKAHRDDDGALVAWNFTTRLPSARANFGALVYKDWIYVIGGTAHGRYYDTVQRATFDARGDIGFMGTEEQARAYRQSRGRAQAAESALPNTGVVEKVIQTDAYSYVQVRTASGLQWLAGPRLDVHVSDTVRYSRGVDMGDFYSRQLKRRFDSIRFVQEIRKAG